MQPLMEKDKRQKKRIGVQNEKKKGSCNNAQKSKKETKPIVRYISSYKII